MNVIRLALLALLIISRLRAAESIRDYTSIVQVQTDATLRISETLVVHAEGKQVRHGIYRDFPTEYRTKVGLRTATSFDVVSIRRDGHDEPWHSERLTNGIRIYLGDAGTVVSPGDHRYEIEYTTAHQLGFFADHDELFWNVTGNGWVLPIEHATAEVWLPDGASVGKTDAFTGPTGSRARDFTRETIADHAVRFRTTRTLFPFQGMTVLVTWQKGIIADDSRNRAIDLIAANATILLGSTLAVLAAAYFLWLCATERRRGHGVVVPRPELPADLSPAAVRYLRLGRYDRGCLAANVLSLAVKGWLTISQTGTQFTVRRRSGATARLTRDEMGLFERLFAGGRELTFSTENAERARSANEYLKATLSDLLEPRYLVLAWSRWGVVLALSSLAIATTLVGAEPLAPAVFLVGISFLLAALGWLFWRALSQSAAGRAAVTVMAVLAAVTASVLIFSAHFPGTRGTAVVLLASVGLIVAAFVRLKTPTDEGARALAQSDGFRAFLRGRDTGAVAAHTDPMSGQLGRWLPYAVALDVAGHWTRHFGSMGSGAGRSRDAGVNDGWFDWYDGPGNSGDIDSIAATMTTVIAASCTPPGSSDFGGGGGGGGGDSGGSGGGGGGGGGGGW